MPPFGTFRSDLPREIANADNVRLRTLACWAYIYLMPAFLFVRQRSKFIQGWELAASAGAPVTSGVSAGAVGVAGAPAVGSWMMLPTRDNTANGVAFRAYDRPGTLDNGVLEAQYRLACVPANASLRSRGSATHDSGPLRLARSLA